MNIIELEKIIEEETLDACNYNLRRKTKGLDEIGLIHEGGKWEVYQSFERGGYRIVAEYDNESEACERIYTTLRLRKDGQLEYEK